MLERYHCTFEMTGPQDLVIEQEETDGVTVYFYNGNPLRADNQVYELPDNEYLKNSVAKGRCVDNALEIWQGAELISSSGTFESTLKISKNLKDDLLLENERIEIVNGQEWRQNNKGRCQRL